MSKVVVFRKKYISLIICSVFFLFIGLVLFKFDRREEKIKIVLESESYSYLPVEAKEFVQSVYDETGDVVLTEKNKKVNEPYLNPKYISYLALSDVEKKSVEVIPDTFLIDYESKDLVAEEYSSVNEISYFDLRNVGGNNYITPLKNQSTLGVCWAMSTVEVAESFLMLKNNTPYNKDTTEIFSVRQIDYATSKDGLIYKSFNSSDKEFENKKFGHRDLGSGGWLWQAAVIGGNGVLLVDEDVLPWNTKNTKLFADDILNYSNSKYEFDSTIRMPNISSSSTVDDKNNYISEVKNYITKYGGAWVSTGSPQGSCAFKNKESDYVIIDNNECATDSDYGFHAMQIIGWDDEYEYEYCDIGTNHVSVNNSSKCDSGVYQKGKGAWILRNSWGDRSAYAYPYLAYDSVDYEVEFISSLSDSSDKTWDNNYFDNFYDFETGQMYYATSFETNFNTGIKNDEKIDKLKFYSFLNDVTYTITISSDSFENDFVKTIVSDYSGLYTIDLSSENLVVNGSFDVNISADKRYALLNNSASFFTSNILSDARIETKYSNLSYDTTIAPSELNPIYIKDLEVNLIFEHLTKNIYDDSKISYRVMNGDLDVTNSFFDINSISNMYVDNYIYSELNVSLDSSMCGNTFKFDVLFDNNVLSSFPLKTSCNGENPKSNIRFYANDGSFKYLDYLKDDFSEIVLIGDNLSVLNENIPGLDSLFKDNEYIKSWNTKMDGTGISYSSNSLLVYNNLDLYAQWDSPHKYYLKYNCLSCEGEDIIQDVEYNTSIVISNNSYEKLSDKFLYWSDENNNIYYEEEIVDNLVDKVNPYNNQYFNFYASWANDTKKITFNSNGGIGTMSSINVESQKDVRLKYNLFSKEGFIFDSWNTKADGSGVTYVDGDIVNIDQDITLYAQWVEVFKIKVSDFEYDEEKLIIRNISSETVVDDLVSRVTTNVGFNLEFDRSKKYVYTGSKIKIFYNDKLDSEVVTIVSGDTNGDGTLSIFDIVKINNHIIDDKKKLEGVYSLAGDFDNDGNLSIFDIVKINNKIIEVK